MIDPEAAVQFANVHKSIKGKPILRGMTCSFPKGEISALLGANGAGKTTCIRVLLGVLKKEMGKIYVFGKEQDEYGTKLRSYFSVLTQENSGYKNMTTIENVKFFLELDGVLNEKTMDKFYGMLDFLSLSDTLPKKWGVLSGGEKRAIGLLRAISTHAELLVLDEPTSGLDIERAMGVRTLIHNEQKEGRTVILSSHILSDIEELAENLVIINNGRIVGTGSKDQIIAKFKPDADLAAALVVAFREENS